jgi:hypothetical protein
MKTKYGETWHDGSNINRRYKRLDVFLEMFPMPLLQHIVEQTNLELFKERKELTTKGEILKLFGIFILATKYEFTSWRNLWAKKGLTQFEPGPDFGETFMTRHRSEDLRRCLRFSEQPIFNPATMTSEQFRWGLVDDFITHFNHHRAINFCPSELLCIDESMIRWYGTGGIGSTKGCRTTWQSIESQRTAARFKIFVVVNRASCFV